MRREYQERSEGLHTCTVLFGLVLAYDMDHFKNLKLKDLKVILCYHFQS